MFSLLNIDYFHLNSLHTWTDCKIEQFAYLNWMQNWTVFILELIAKLNSLHTWTDCKIEEFAHLNWLQNWTVCILKLIAKLLIWLLRSHTQMVLINTQILIQPIHPYLRVLLLALEGTVSIISINPLHEDDKQRYSWNLYLANNVEHFHVCLGLTVFNS